MFLAVMALAVSFPLPAETVSANWEAHQVKFNFFGYNSMYTCDGISAAVRSLLIAFGARDDARVEARCTGMVSEIEQRHTLLLAFAVPVIADSSEFKAETFPAEWREVRIGRNRPRGLGNADCELVEQFHAQVLTRLRARNIKKKSRCHFGSVRQSPNLSLTLLMPLEEADL